MLYTNIYQPAQIFTLTAEGSLTAGEDRRLDYCLKYPRVMGSKGISRFYQTGVKSYEQTILSRYRTALYQMPPGERSIESDYQVGFNKCRLLSIYVDTYEAMGAYRTAVRRSAATWDIHTGRKLSTEDIFSDRAQLCRIVSHHIDREIADSQAASQGSYFLALRPHVWDWHLSERGLVVFFQPETIAPKNSGLPSFLLTWGEIGHLARFEISEN